MELHPSSTRLDGCLLFQGVGPLKMVGCPGFPVQPQKKSYPAKEDKLPMNADRCHKRTVVHFGQRLVENRVGFGFPGALWGVYGPREGRGFIGHAWMVGYAKLRKGF